MITSVVALVKILKAPASGPVAPNPTVKKLLVISPALKLELATVGWVASLGNSVRKPGPEGTTVMLPMMAVALSGMVEQTVRAACVRVELAASAPTPMVQPETPAPLRVSSNRTGAANG